MSGHTPLPAAEAFALASDADVVAALRGVPQENPESRALMDEIATRLEQRAEMLAALKNTLDYWESIGFAQCDEGCDCIVEDVRAAIAKAEGL